MKVLFGPIPLLPSSMGEIDGESPSSQEERLTSGQELQEAEGQSVQLTRPQVQPRRLSERRFGPSWLCFREPRPSSRFLLEILAAPCGPSPCKGWAGA